jgi:hypothetical protein
MCNIEQRRQSCSALQRKPLHYMPGHPRRFIEYIDFNEYDRAVEFSFGFGCVAASVLTTSID